MDKSKYLPRKGGWIMIRSLIPIDKPIVDPLSLWYAIPTGKIFVNDELHVRNFMCADDYDLRVGMRLLRIGDWEVYKRILFDFMVNGKTNSFDRATLEQIVKDVDGDVNFQQQVQIKTLFGDVNIMPHEYTICQHLDNYFEAIKDGHAFMRYMTKSDTLAGKLADQIFYLRSRGIGYSEALQLVWQNIKSPNQFYIEFHPAYMDQFVRGWQRYFFDKIQWMKKHDRMDLLNYGKQWSTEEFISDYQKQEAA
jgi:hypothetical protein